MLKGDFRIFSSYIGDRLAPERGSCEHIGFIDAGQAALARGSALERIARHTFDLSRVIFRDVARARMAIITMQFVCAEIDVAREFAHDFKIATRYSVGAKRRNSLQRMVQTDRAKINVETEFLANREEAAFRAICERKRVPLRPSNGAEQNRVGRAALGER